MIGLHTRAEDTLHAVDELRGEGNLGHQHQHIAATGEHLTYKIHIYFCLSRTRNALQKMHPSGGANLPGHTLLLGGKFR